jgi:hypothetical protein
VPPIQNWKKKNEVFYCTFGAFSYTLYYIYIYIFGEFIGIIGRIIPYLLENYGAIIFFVWNIW